MCPTFSQFGGNFAGGFKLSIGNSNSGGAVYYTLDGSDPRFIGGASNTAAKVYSSPIELSGNVTVQARYRSASGVWSALVECAIFAIVGRLLSAAISIAMATAPPPISCR